MIFPLLSSPAAAAPTSTLATAIAEHQASSYYAKWVRDNRTLGPAVDAYLRGGQRPADALIGANHYGRALVLTEDVRRG